MMTPSTTETLMFTTRKKEPELIPPSRPTPHEFKHLSDIDQRFRFQTPVIHFYRNNKKNGKFDRKSNPVDVIREAIGNALVFYYPLAGRIRELTFGGKLVVECTGEGVMFIEADADVRLDQFNNFNDLKPPFPCLNELLYLVPGSVDLINCPLLLIQVTRLLCGGFILAVRHSHTICDAQGIKQFLMALGEIARGYESPSVLPVWQRELLSSHEPPATPNRECDLFHRNRVVSLPFSQNQEVQCTFFFGLQEMISLRKHLPLHLHTCSNFEILTACLWRCRILAFNLDPKEDVRLFFSVNGRGKDRLNLPEGFYGNALGCGMAFSTADQLCRNSFEYTLDLVVKSKNKLLNRDTKEDNDTTMKNKMLKSWTEFTTNYALIGNNYFVTDSTRARFSEVDYGWGKAVYAGPMIVHHIPNPEDSSFYIPYENSKGEYGIYVPICLRQQFMKRFVVEVGRMISEPPIKLNNQFRTSKKPVRSAL